jgi:hypothetical protein
MIQRCFLLVLIALAGMIVSCLLLGIGLYWGEAAVAAVGVFAMICLLAEPSTTSAKLTWG